MGSRFSKIAVSLLWAVCISGLLFAQTGGNTSDPARVTKEKLEAIDAEIQSLRAQAARLAEHESSIITVLNQLDVESQIRSHEIQLLDLKQKKTKEDILMLETRLGELEKKLKDQESYLVQRLVEAYKLGEMNYVKLLLNVDSASDFIRSYQYISFLARDDHRRVQEYRASLEETRESRTRLDQENRNLALIRQDFESTHRALLRSRQEKVRLLSAVQDQKEMHLSALTDLRAAANQLQNFFQKSEPTVVTGGISMMRSKGALDWPVYGKILRGFGTYKHPKFATITMSNGVEISALEGTPVKAIFDGEVAFSEWFKGYGQCIILSHFDGFYTLYGHNSQLLVQRGQKIRRGQIIAKVGSTGALYGPGLYFEIRKKDQPLNPLEWLER